MENGGGLIEAPGKQTMPEWIKPLFTETLAKRGGKWVSVCPKCGQELDHNECPDCGYRNEGE